MQADEDQRPPIPTGKVFVEHDTQEGPWGASFPVFWTFASPRCDRQPEAVVEITAMLTTPIQPLARSQSRSTLCY